MTPETPTPETDDHSDRMDNEDFDVELALTYDLARRLERERDAARAENAAMKDAIKAAYVVLKMTARKIIVIDSNNDKVLSCQDNEQPSDLARVAQTVLTKLKPFLPNTPLQP